MFTCQLGRRLRHARRGHRGVPVQRVSGAVRDEPGRREAITAPLDVLASFFAAENWRDWARYAEFLHPDVEWTIGKRVVRGRDAYLEAMTTAYSSSSAQFRVHQHIASSDASVVATLLVDSEGNRSLDVFELEDGLIRRESEYLLGPGEDWNGDGVKLRGNV